MYKVLALLTLVSVALTFTIAPASAMQFHIDEQDDSIERDIVIQYVPSWETLVKGWDWFNRFIQLIRLAWQLQQAVQEHWIEHGQGWWTHNGEISCDIFNGVVSWR